MTMSQIPVIDAPRGPGALAAAHIDQCRALRDAIVGRVPDVLLAALDQRAQVWLREHRNPHLAELDAINEKAGRLHGLYLLNTCYEWACSTMATADPEGGNRLYRTLDWAFSGLGEHMTLGRHESAAGPWLNLTWPGCVGVLTAVCPGRFSAAINQAPMAELTSIVPLDLVHGWRQVWKHGGLPAVHLLRRVCEAAFDFDEAIKMLCEEPRVSKPCFFVLSGVRPDENAVIERLEDRAIVHTDPDRICVTNDWLSPDLSGRPRGHGIGRDALEQDCAARRAALMRTTSAAWDFDWVTPPVRNDRTRLACVGNASAGRIMAVGLEAADGKAEFVTEALDFNADRNS